MDKTTGVESETIGGNAPAWPVLEKKLLRVIREHVPSNDTLFRQQLDRHLDTVMAGSDFTGCLIGFKKGEAYISAANVGSGSYSR